MPHNPYPMLINGELVASADGKWIESVNPGTEEIIGRAPAGTVADVDKAVAAASHAQPAWAALSIWERGAKLRELAAAIRARTDDIKHLEAADSGNTIGNLDGDLHKASHHFEYFAGLATELKGDTVPATAKGLHLTLRQPFGVVGRIVPFNHPFMFAAANLAAPLVAGNTVVLKSPETSPLSASVLGELCRDVLPPGVVNIVSGFGMPVGDRIARHPEVRRIGFTGSIATGLAIQKAAAEVCVKQISLELGGKNPLIICDDADLESAVDAAVAGMNFAWAGQSCGSTSRLLVHTSQYERSIELLRDRLGRIKVGDALDPESEMGPLNSRPHYERVMSLIDQGVRIDKARVIIGAERPAGATFAKGFWVAPTLFADVTPAMVVGQKEIFGPVMCVSSFETDHEAIALANATTYGLTASVFGCDLGRVLSIAQQLEAGVVAVNSTKMHYVGLPFGGTKDSGLGGEECLDELLSYTRPKAIHISL